MTDDESWVPEWVDRELYPFTPRRLEVLGEGTLNYLDESPADPQHGPVVFVHGTPTWSFEWRYLVAGLKDSYRCLAPDQLGIRPLREAVRRRILSRGACAPLPGLDRRALTYLRYPTNPVIIWVI